MKGQADVESGCGFKNSRDKKTLEPSITTALVVEGGAFRGVFSTGLLDAFLAAEFNPFDLYIGVSSGASNLAAFLANMPGRNRCIYLDYSLRPEFIDIARFLAGGNLLNLDWLWENTIRDIRLDLDAIYSKGRPFIVVMTDVQTGMAYYKATAAGNLERALKASSAVPLFYRDYPEIDGRPMTDGGVADAIPVSEAIRRGAHRIMVVRSRQRDYQKHPGVIAECVMAWYLRPYPALKQAMAARVSRYNDTVTLIRKPPVGIEIVEICPPDNFRVSRLSRDPRILQEGYEQGRAMAAEAIARWNGS
jgi:predicted patatin/cPLA2 family phospholipase